MGWGPPLEEWAAACCLSCCAGGRLARSAPRLGSCGAGQGFCAARALLRRHATRACVPFQRSLLHWPALPQVGGYQLEAQRGRFVGPRQLAFVVIPDPAAAEELRQLEADAKGALHALLESVPDSSHLRLPGPLPPSLPSSSLLCMVQHEQPGGFA